jgi:hypothetical protein
MGWKEWVSVLELSCMWQIATVREKAMKKILEFQVSATDGQLELLRLSTRLGIQEIRDAAIQALWHILGPIELVRLGTELQVDEWLLQGYTRLAHEGISMEDEKQLGWKTASKLFRIRDEYLQMLYKDPRSTHASSSIVSRTIKKVFVEELNQAAWVRR